MKHWHNRKNALAIILYPLSWIYRFLTFCHRLLYHLGLFQVHYFPVPIIVVGNISVGGTGKTPCVRALAQFLKESGKKPGIVLRGYGGKSTNYPLIVTAGSQLREVGDEALMLSKSTDIPIGVSPNRPEAVALLLQRFNCDVIISDDGLGHLALDRDIEIVMIDGQRYHSNKWLLPAGPLRESLTRLRSVDCLLINSPECEQDADLNPEIFNVHVAPESFISLNNGKKEKMLRTSKVHALAGIGNPTRFFNLLTSMGYDVVPNSFPDHHQFSKEDIDIEDADFIVMTEKDAVKCAPFSDKRHWYLKTYMIFPEGFKEFILNKLASID